MSRGDNLRSDYYRFTVEEVLILDLYQLESIKSESFKEFVQSDSTGIFKKSILEIYFRNQKKGEMILNIEKEKSRLILKLLYSSNNVRIEEIIQLSYQKLVSGGLKFYLHCPNCQRRSTKVYLIPILNRFLCRKCGRLTYESCKQSEHTNKFHYLIAASSNSNPREVKQYFNMLKRERRLNDLSYIIEKNINEGDNMHATTIKLGELQNKQLNLLSKKNDLPKSELIRRAVDMYLDTQTDRELKENQIRQINTHH
ncbi:MAG: hypothetical protein H6611_09755 [Ignavibacteriales bacterium]|nr:hypothetical protein [Ignavibacteriales bacterium]